MCDRHPYQPAWEKPKTPWGRIVFWWGVGLVVTLTLAGVFG